MAKSQSSAHKELMKSIYEQFNETIYEYFKNNEILRKRYIENKTYQQIADELGKDLVDVKDLVKGLVAKVKIDLAERGYFERLTLAEEDKAEYFYLRKRITAKGITAVHIADGVSFKSLSKYLKVKRPYLTEKIDNDRKVVIEKLKANNIDITSNNSTLVANLFIEIFENHVKNFDKIPDDCIQYINEQIQDQDELIYTYFYPQTSAKSKLFWKTKNISNIEKEDIVIDKVFNLKDDAKEYMKIHSQAKASKKTEAPVVNNTTESSESTPDEKSEKDESSRKISYVEDNDFEPHNWI